MSHPDDLAHSFYLETLEILEEAKVPVLVGGAFAQEFFTGISRDTKDLDLFLMERDLHRALAALNRGGFQTKVAFAHWLGKAYDNNGGQFVDIIFNSGNGLCKVDESWFDRAPEGEVFSRSVKFCPVEESIWQKAFIMERERYDGADIAHLLRAQSDKLDWNRLLSRFGKHWRVLLSYIVLFGYIYPTERTRIPDWVQRKLSNLFACEIGQDARGENVCAGTLLSRAQFIVDIDEWGYRDMRTPELMSAEALEHWTAAATEEKKT
jgi:hypothetical protein